MDFSNFTERKLFILYMNIKKKLQFIIPTITTTYDFIID